ncbi:MAG: hypothetical protein ACOC8K_06890 [Gemmatimonadota bacterium]
MRRRFPVVVAVLATASTAIGTVLPGPTPLAAQAPDDIEGSPPAGWEILTDDVGADTDAIAFAAMEPGFHLTTGPAALFYDPGNTARGSYRAHANIHLFAPEDPGAPFGLFVGGSDLDGSYQTYTALLLRASGEFSVLRRLSFTSSETLVEWTSHDGVRGWARRDEGAQTVENSLSIEVRDGEMTFFVNDEEVARVPRTDQGGEGVAGLRVEEGVNLHVTDFEVEPL